jgi:hypothetical protein
MMKFQKIYAEFEFDVSPAVHVHSPVPQLGPASRQAGSYQYEVTIWL